MAVGCTWFLWERRENDPEEQLFENKGTAEVNLELTPLVVEECNDNVYQSDYQRVLEQRVEHYATQQHSSLIKPCFIDSSFAKC